MVARAEASAASCRLARARPSWVATVLQRLDAPRRAAAGNLPLPDRELGVARTELATPPYDARAWPGSSVPLDSAAVEQESRRARLLRPERNEGRTLVPRVLSGHESVPPPSKSCYGWWLAGT